jgi:hypothetical protein
VRERAQLRGVGHERDQPVQAELVEPRGRPATVDPAAHLERPPGLRVGLGQLGEVGDHAADADREAPASAALVAGHAVHRASYDGFVVVGRGRQQRDHLRGEVDAGGRRVDARGDRAPRGREPLLPLPVLVLRDRLLPGSRWVDLGGDHDQRPDQVPAEAGRVLDDVVLLAGAAEEDVAEEVAAVLALDRGDGFLARDQQRGDGRGALHGPDVVARDLGVVADADEAGQVAAAGDDAEHPYLSLADRGAVGSDLLRAEAAGRVEEPGRVEGRAGDVGECCRPLPAVARGDQHAEAEGAGELLGDHAQVASLEHDLGEPDVQRVEAFERRAWHRLSAVNSCTCSPASLAEPHIAHRIAGR